MSIKSIVRLDNDTVERLLIWPRFLLLAILTTLFIGSILLYSLLANLVVKGLNHSFVSTLLADAPRGFNKLNVAIHNKLLKLSELLFRKA